MNLRVESFLSPRNYHDYLFQRQVNSYDAQFVKAIRQRIEGLAGDDEVRGVVLTATGPYPWFGFNIPRFLDWPREDFED